MVHWCHILTVEPENLVRRYYFIIDIDPCWSWQKSVEIYDCQFFRRRCVIKHQIYAHIVVIDDEYRFVREKIVQILIYRRNRPVAVHQHQTTLDDGSILVVCKYNRLSLVGVFRTGYAQEFAPKIQAECRCGVDVEYGLRPFFPKI